MPTHDELRPTAPDDDTRDDRFEEILTEYVDRMNSGEMIEKDEVLRDHPRRASEIWQRLELFQGIGQQREKSLGTLGDFQIIRQIGQGGMGAVYEAHQISMDRRVALKVLPAGLLADLNAVARFEREARVVGQLQHPNIVAVHGIGVDENTPHFSMDLVEGETLAQILERVRDGEPEGDTPFGKKDDLAYFGSIARSFAEVADGLWHAHSKGIIHRDIKPSNLILDEERRLRILDFGLARIEGQGSLTVSGDIVGTPLYMSPEQARRKKVRVDHRTDIWSLGVTMYETLCGRPPFRGKDHGDTLTQIAEREPVDLRRLNPRVPSDFVTIVLKCLRKRPEERYGTSEALAQDLRRFARGDPIEARDLASWEKAARFVWRRRKLAIGIGAFLVLSAIGLSTSVFLIWREKEKAASSLELARMNLRIGREAVDELLTRVGDVRFALVPEMEPARRGLIERALEFHAGFLEQDQDDPEGLRAAARAYLAAARTYESVGQRRDARAACADAVRLLERLVDREPEDEAASQELADARSVGSLLERLGLPDETAVVTRVPLDAPVDGVVDVKAADVDGDGWLELLALGRFSASLTALRSQEGRDFEPGNRIPVGLDPIRLAVGDLDGDDDEDFVTLNQGSMSVSVVDNNAGGLVPEKTLKLPFVPWAMVAANLDRDRRIEVAIVGLGLSVLERDADGALVLGEAWPVEGLPNSIDASDLDADGDVDLVIGSHRNREGFLWMLWNDGSGAFPERTETPIPGMPTSLICADFDADGALDVAVADHFSGNFFIVRNRGARVLEPGAVYPVASQRVLLSAADLDGDGDVDAALCREADGLVTMMLNEGDGRFSKSASFKTGGKAFLGAAHDLDADGEIDLAIANGTTNDVAILFHARELAARDTRTVERAAVDATGAPAHEGDE